MKVAILSARKHREYLLDTFARHPEAGLEPLCFVNWGLPDTDAVGEIPVVPLEALKSVGADMHLLAINRMSRQSRLLTWLHDAGLSNVYCVRSYPLACHADFLSCEADGAGQGGFSPQMLGKLPDAVGTKPWLPYLEAHVCDHCNLNCKACNHFAPFIRERSVTDPAAFDRDLRELGRLFSNIGKLNLMGGEPLLEPELCQEMVRLGRGRFPDAELYLTTNASRISRMSPAFWDCLRENRVIIQITVYPPLQRDVPAWERILRGEGIPYLLYRDGARFAKYLLAVPAGDAAYNNEVCTSGGCHFLYDGRISKCPDALLHGWMLRSQGRDAEETRIRNSIRLADARDGWDLLKALDQPCELCSYCDFSRAEVVPWGASGAAPDPADWLLPVREQTALPAGNA